MEKEQLRQKILYLRDVMGMSFYQIEDVTGISRKRTSRIYYGYLKAERKKKACVFDSYHSLISNWFKEYPSLKALQVYNWLKERGVDISYPRVVQYTRDFRRKKEKFYHQLSFLPGEEAQVDWFYLNHPVLGKLWGFTLVLSYSRYCFGHMFPRSSFEFFIEGHEMAFSAMGGTAHSCRYDNIKSVVLKRSPEIQHNPRFLEFCRHYGIGIRLCNPARGNEKGRVERLIRSLRETFLNTVLHYTSLKAINQALHQWIEGKNHTLHRVTEKRPVDLLKEEKLKPLPEIRWNNITIHPPVKTTKTAMIIFDTNSYSVPDYLVGKPLSIHSTPTTVKIYDRDKEVASHPRSFQRHEQIINPLHRNFTCLSSSAKIDRIHDVIKGMHPSIEDFLLKNQLCGENPKKTAYEIFKLLKSHSRAMIISAIAESIRIKSPRLKTLLSYFHTQAQDNTETVHPQNIEVLNITYKARELEEYDE